MIHPSHTSPSLHPPALIISHQSIHNWTGQSRFYNHAVVRHQIYLNFSKLSILTKCVYCLIVDFYLSSWIHGVLAQFGGIQAEIFTSATQNHRDRTHFITYYCEKVVTCTCSRDAASNNSFQFYCGQSSPASQFRDVHFTVYQFIMKINLDYSCAQKY